jgi:hypothetical protein
MAAKLCWGMLQVPTGRDLSPAAFVAAAAGVEEVEQAGVLFLVTRTVRPRLYLRYTFSQLARAKVPVPIIGSCQPLPQV